MRVARPSRTRTRARACAVALAFTLVASITRVAGADDDATARPWNEPYVASGVAFFTSPRRVLAGGGGGLGYRVHLSHGFSVHADGRWLFYVANAFSGTAGVTYRRLVTGRWEPMGGLQASVFGGQAIEVVTSAKPSLPPPLAWAAGLHLAPLRFVRGRFAASALVFDVGLGADGGLAFALAISILEIGVQF